MYGACRQHHARYIPYQLANVNGEVQYCFPNGTSVISIPFVALMGAFGVSPSTPDHQYNAVGEAVIQRFLASLLMAAFTVVIFRSALLLLGVLPSLVVAAGAAFGTQVWSTASRAMWSHTWLIFLGALLAYSLLRRETGQRKPGPVILATLVCWMYFIRPTGSIQIVCVTAYLFAFHRRELPAYGLTGLVWFGGFLAYSSATFGKLLPDYYSGSRLDLCGLPIALPSILFSPSRGLFIYVPVLFFVFYLVLEYWNTLPFQRLAVLALAMVTMQILMTALFPKWWGDTHMVRVC